MVKTTLLIMAAGLGSRFGGGIKQLEPVGLNGEIIIDYSIHDAIKAGFNRIVFIIRKEIEADFFEVIGKRIEKLCRSCNVEVCYAYQSLTDIPAQLPEGRTKPWGTGQAVLAAKEYLTTPFAAINADDYYGKSAFVSMHDWLIKPHADTELAMAGFILKNTLSDNGGVTRGVCQVKEGTNFITDVVETRKIEKTAEGAEAKGVKLNPDAYVSMNFWGFPGNPPKYIQLLEKGFEEFFKTTVPHEPLMSEYLLPIHIGGLLRAGQVTLEALKTSDSWFGMTYREDIPTVKSSFASLINAGEYGEKLYADLEQ